MKAAILAAGRGTRLGSLTATVPKCLVHLSDGFTILDAALSALLAHSVCEVVVVTGHAHNKLAGHLEEKWAGTQLRPTLVYNRLYDQANNIVSFACALPLFLETDEVLLINSDVVFDPDILRRLMSAPGSALVVDDHKALGNEGMKVMVDEQMRVVTISKLLDPTQAYGEYIGLAKLVKHTSDWLSSVVKRWISDNRVQAYYEDAWNDALDRAVMRVVSTEDQGWVEVDTLEDLLEARRLFQRLAEEGGERFTCAR